MAKPAPEYELILMLDPELPDERRDALAVEARKRIEAGAELRQERTWGLRKMAYEIDHRNEADYRFFRFANGQTVLEDLNHNLRIADGVLRFRIFKVDPRAPVIDPPPPVALAAAAPARPGSRRRDEERPPRGPDPDADAAPAAVAAPEAPAETPAPEAVAEAPDAPATETATEASEAPATETATEASEAPATETATEAPEAPAPEPVAEAPEAEPAAPAESVPAAEAAPEPPAEAPADEPESGSDGDES